MANLAVIGHIAIDKIVTHISTRTQLGGPPAYVALAARQLGKEIEANTKVGEDLPDSFLFLLSGLGIDLQGMIVEGAETTRFTLDYRGVERSLSVDNVCVEIGLEDVAGVSEAALITPIIGEVSPTTIAGMDSDIIALDPQGFLREVLDDGSIRLKRWFNGETLRRVNVFKSSVRELELVTGESNPWVGLDRILRKGVEIAMSTKGGEGAYLSTVVGHYLVPAYDTVPVDPTGAGDAFIGCFFMEYLEGEEPLWCASMASAVASYVVETMGVEIDTSLKGIRERAEDVFNRSKKL
jgi:sugar/nucleoside kinase (ribokinase family)